MVLGFYWDGEMSLSGVLYKNDKRHRLRVESKLFLLYFELETLKIFQEIVQRSLCRRWP